MAPVNPGAITAINAGVSHTPSSTSTDVTSDSRATTAPARRVASFSSPRASSAAYAGMKEAESAPSPNRF